VFSLDELQKIAKFAEKYNLIVLSDEVYEALCYDGTKHIKFGIRHCFFHARLFIDLFKLRSLECSIERLL
jgi:bifunctional pyridoxal-dependent enzyme with beta-cystathionase and maltose regulon repressor activities